MSRPLTVQEILAAADAVVPHLKGWGRIEPELPDSAFITVNYIQDGPDVRRCVAVVQINKNGSIRKVMARSSALLASDPRLDLYR